MTTLKQFVLVALTLGCLAMHTYAQASPGTVSTPVHPQPDLSFPVVSAIPGLKMQEATKVGERYLEGKSIPVVNSYLISAVLRSDQTDREFFWQLVWHVTGREGLRGGVVTLKISMSGAITEMDSPYAPPMLPESIEGLAEPSNPVTCDERCLKDVEALVQMERSGGTVSWVEKANSWLGDSAALGLAHLHRSETLYRTANFRWYLPILVKAFESTELIRNPSARKPVHTLRLLNRLLGKNKDPYWRHQIQRTINAVMYNTGSFRVILPDSPETLR